jgi:hypothetical protein
MNAKRVVQLLALTVIVAVGIISCGGLSSPVSIDQRLTDFIDSLNTSTRSGIQDNFHPTDTTDYSTLPNIDWTTWFPLVNGGTSYSLSSVDKTNSPTVTAVIDGPTAFQANGTPAIKFVMDLYGTDDYRIQKLYLGINQTNPPNIIQ